jgi:hypothetical protein
MFILNVFYTLRCFVLESAKNFFLYQFYCVKNLITTYVTHIAAMTVSLFRLNVMLHLMFLEILG